MRRDDVRVVLRLAAMGTGVTRRATGRESCQVPAALRYLDSVDVVQDHNRREFHITVVCQRDGEACRIPGSHCLGRRFLRHQNGRIPRLHRDFG